LEDKQNPEKRAEFREKLAKYLAIAKTSQILCRYGSGTRRDLVYESFDAKLGKKGKKENNGPTAAGTS